MKYNRSFAEWWRFGEQDKFLSCPFKTPLRQDSTVRRSKHPFFMLYILTQHLAELDKTRSSNARSGGGSIFASSASSVPNELVPLVAPQQTISKLVLSTKTSVNGANQDYAKLTDPNAVTPSPPVHAARLNGLLKTLANAEGAVAESIKARKLLIEGLEKILDTNRSVLASEEAQLSEISTKRTEIDNKKRDVEESIMRGFSNSNPATPVGDGSPGTQHSPLTPGQSGSVEPDRPEVEALTPPGYPQSPAVEPIPEYDLNQNHNGHNNGNQAMQNTNGHGNGTHNLYQQDYTAHSPTGAPGLDLLSSLSTTYARPASSGSAKKRKLNDDEFPDLGGEDAMDGLDDEVVGILNKGL